MSKFTAAAAIAAFLTFPATAYAGFSGGHCAPHAPVCAPTYLQHSGHYVTQSYSYVTQPAITVRPTCGSYSPCNPVLAGPPLMSHTYDRGVTYTEHMPIARATREIVRGECPTGTTYQADGTCLEPGIISGSSYTSYPTGSYSSSSWSSSSSYSSSTCGSSTLCGGSSHVGTVPTTRHKVWSHTPKKHYRKHKAHKRSESYCYTDSAKRYDRHGYEIKSGCR